MGRSISIKSILFFDKKKESFTSLLVSKQHNKMALQKEKIGTCQIKLGHCCFKKMFQKVFGGRLFSQLLIFLIDYPKKSWDIRVLWMYFLPSTLTYPFLVNFPQKVLGVSHLSTFMVKIGVNLILQLLIVPLLATPILKKGTSDSILLPRNSLCLGMSPFMRIRIISFILIFRGRVFGKIRRIILMHVSFPLLS